MPVTTLPRPAKRQQKKSVLKATPTGSLIVANEHLPHAGWGACTSKGCTCKQYVRSEVRDQFSSTGHQPSPCATCGHDVRYHA
ncbi:MAG: hypothetical protein NTW29_10270 [Bacteroidetes bacterium]|nr:hypothetical protein [Bacteroidota bacterium]